MDTRDWLARQFEEERPHLRAVAYRLLGSPSEADDAVQESWLRLSRGDASSVTNLGGWLTTVVARICLDQLRARKARREEVLDATAPEPVAGREDGGDPEDEALLADAVGVALLVVLDALNPAERLAFVLHDLFDVPFDTIAPIVGRSPDATRQLASRARRRVRARGQGLEPEHEQEDEAATDAAIPATDVDLTRQRAVVDAFLAASRGGDFNALLALLDPDIVFRADQTAAAAAGLSEVHGATEVARQFAGRARGAQRALINGAAGAVWAPGGQLRAVFAFTIAGNTITAIELISDSERLRALDVAILGE